MDTKVHEMTLTPGDVGALLEAEESLKIAKAQKIQGLLQERVDLVNSTDSRLKGIASELKSLGWHRSKVSKTAKATAK